MRISAHFRPLLKFDIKLKRSKMIPEGKYWDMSLNTQNRLSGLLTWHRGVNEEAQKD
ncbi:hypothetical protein BY996DRAFT_6524482 [Phakopsora pachyrhizi]|nr:hypothetical protein BY996DRAFT_6524482 [Phakopsora pachyrhizi]